MKTLLNLIISFSTILLFSCSGGHPTEEATDQPEATESHEGHQHMEEAQTELPAVVAPEGARVFFDNLEEGATVTSPFMVHFGVEGIEVHPAGELIEGTGHHHIIIDEGPVPLGEVVPADDHHIHFGGGQTDTELTLEPGSYALTLQFADGLHRSYGEGLSATVHINVEAAE